MVRGHITLPALQFAAAAFFATGALAETYCVNGNHQVVAATNCEDANNVSGHFTEVDGPAGVSLGSVVTRRNADADDDDYDGTRVVRAAAPEPTGDDHETGGFGEIEDREAKKAKATGS